ncbi:hypothetical protein QBC40DRAFT_309495 [Triangularia verruculosa]|uniref:BHLH domain-containing protein n=1 Tax=Triangularia verruculosa TaxID=2587418 RepID=A0AAN7ATI9_9PEZI|nr:hypothetical protein QBC40DRAFT_309495 [Triangularia verruculosa]
MEQTPQWVQGGDDQLPEGHRGPTDIQRWVYGEVFSNNSGYHGPSFSHDASNLVDPSSYQPSPSDDRLPSPTQSHSGVAFAPGASSVFQGRWISNSPASPPAPYADIARTLSSASSVLSPSISDSWAYSHYSMGHPYGPCVSTGQPVSPTLALDFDASPAGQSIPETYFAESLVPNITSTVGQVPHTTALPSPPIHLNIEANSIRQRRLSQNATASEARQATKHSGKGQIPSPSSKPKVGSRTSNSKAASPISSGLLQAQQQLRSNGPSLRTAARRFKRTAEEAPPKPGESLEDQRARENHNQVEKEYRNRLHRGFEELLDALHGLPVEELLAARPNNGTTGVPTGEQEEEDEHIAIIGALLDERASLGLSGNNGKGKKKQKRVSKAEVLHYTCMVLRSMGHGNQRLKEEVEELKLLRDEKMGGKS